MGTEQQPDSRPGHYYVSALPDPATGYYLLAGPWPTHAGALAQVDAVRRFAEYADPVKAPWMAYGTCRYPETEPAPISRLGADPPAWQLYSLWVRMHGVRPGGKYYDAGYYRKVSSDEPLTHREALIVRSKYSDPANIMLYPYGEDPNAQDPKV
jgi:hypothetical protein